MSILHFFCSQAHNVKYPPAKQNCGAYTDRLINSYSSQCPHLILVYSLIKMSAHKKIPLCPTAPPREHQHTQCSERGMTEPTNRFVRGCSLLKKLFHVMLGYGENLTEEGREWSREWKHCYLLLSEQKDRWLHKATGMWCRWSRCLPLVLRSSPLQYQYKSFLSILRPGSTLTAGSTDSLNP